MIRGGAIVEITGPLCDPPNQLIVNGDPTQCYDVNGSPIIATCDDGVLTVKAGGAQISDAVTSIECQNCNRNFFTFS